MMGEAFQAIRHQEKCTLQRAFGWIYQHIGQAPVDTTELAFYISQLIWYLQSFMSQQGHFDLVPAFCANGNVFFTEYDNVKDDCISERHFLEVIV
jgi:hypothetical protein